jgi:coenzyme PQQ synthesis protein D (PqqD)
VRNDSLMDADVRFPEHVVFRSFATETVALNLHTGKFHGLNVTAGRMVEVLGRSGRPRDAIAPLAEEYDISQAQIERDLAALLALLLERDLILLD